MFKQIITDWLDTQKLRWKQSGDGYLLCQCPNPEHDDSNESCFVSTMEGWLSCKACGFYVSPKTFTNDSQELKDLHLKSRFNDIINKLESKFQTINDKNTVFALPPAHKFPDEYRGLSKEFLSDINAFICLRGRFQDRLIFPFYNIDNELVGYTGRYIGNSTDKSIPKYMHSTGIQPSNHILFGKYMKDNNIDTSTLIVTEGSQDALHLLQLGVAATPSLGFRTPSDNWVLEAIKLGTDRVILCWDNDNAGVEKMLGNKQSLFNKWKEKIPTTLGLFDNKTKWLYKSNFKDFGEAGEKIIGSSSMLELMMGT